MSSGLGVDGDHGVGLEKSYQADHEGVSVLPYGIWILFSRVFSKRATEVIFCLAIAL